MDTTKVFIQEEIRNYDFQNIENILSKISNNLEDSSNDTIFGSALAVFVALSVHFVIKFIDFLVKRSKLKKENLSKKKVLFTVLYRLRADLLTFNKDNEKLRQDLIEGLKPNHVINADKLLSLNIDTLKTFELYDLKTLLTIEEITQFIEIKNGILSIQDNSCLKNFDRLMIKLEALLELKSNKLDFTEEIMSELLRSVQMKFYIDMLTETIRLDAISANYTIKTINKLLAIKNS